MLRHVEDFLRAFADKYNLKRCAVIVVGMDRGSVVITLLVPESIELKITSVDPEFISSHGIIHMIFNDITVYPQVSE